MKEYPRKLYDEFKYCNNGKKVPRVKNKYFTEQEKTTLQDVMRHRRDVRGNHFVDKPLDNSVVQQILQVAEISPSVGFSQPWEFVIIRDQQTKQAVADVFAVENIKAEKQFSDEKRQQYAALKLEGILKTPVNIAVFYKPSKDAVLGQTSMEEMGEYSVVCAVQNMWLMSRALNVGMGWVSILDPEKVKEILNAPQQNKLVAYLCLGYVDEFLESPELEQLKWQSRAPLEQAVHQERYKD